MSQNADEILLLEEDTVEPLSVRPMREGLFGKTLEDALQTLLERHPQVIPGKQIDSSSDDPPRFVLLRRETPLSGWSVDHLFVDQKGILTLVEAKLLQNPESRRDVIGQVIEYAANAARAWANGQARQHGVTYYHDRAKDLDAVLHEAFGEELDTEAFWQTVEDNLATGRIRVIIASDEIRPEVRRMIEYLNLEMQTVEVLGLELRCYGSDETSLVLVPRIIGQTQSNIDRKSGSQDRVRWTADAVMQAVEAMGEVILQDRLRRIAHWAEEHQVFGQSVAKELMFSVTNRAGQRLWYFYGSGKGFVGLAAKYFDGDEGAGVALGTRLQSLGLLPSDLSIPEVRDGKSFSRGIQELDDEEFEQLLAMLQEYCDQGQDKTNSPTGEDWAAQSKATN